MLVEGLVLLLANDPGVSGELGSAGTRKDHTNGIFPNIAPKEVMLPYIVYQQVTGSQIRTMDGSPALQDCRIQFFCYGASYKQAKVLARKVKALLAGFLGVLGDDDATSLQGAWLANELDSIEQDPHGSLYGVLLHYDFIFLDTFTATEGMQ